MADEPCRRHLQRRRFRELRRQCFRRGGWMHGGGRLLLIVIRPARLRLWLPRPLRFRQPARQSLPPGSRCRPLLLLLALPPPPLLSAATAGCGTHERHSSRRRIPRPRTTGRRPRTAQFRPPRRGQLAAWPGRRAARLAMAGAPPPPRSSTSWAGGARPMRGGSCRCGGGGSMLRLQFWPLRWRCAFIKFCALSHLARRARRCGASDPLQQIMLDRCGCLSLDPRAAAT
jgi:hypothetical protein